MQVWTQDADDEVLAMVVRTGVCTVIGSMLRQVFAPYKEFQVGVQLVEVQGNSLGFYAAMPFSLPGHT